jgi:hypothetical protein
VLIANLDHYTWLDVARPIVILIAVNLGMAAIGRRRAIALAAGG